MKYANNFVNDRFSITPSGFFGNSPDMIQSRENFMKPTELNGLYTFASSIKVWDVTETHYNEDGTIDYSRPDDRPTAADVFGQRQREAEAALSTGNLSGKALQDAQNALSYANEAVQKQQVFQASFTPQQWNEKLGVRFTPAGTPAGYEYSADKKQ